MFIHVHIHKVREGLVMLYRTSHFGKAFEAVNSFSYFWLDTIALFRLEGLTIYKSCAFV